MFYCIVLCVPAKAGTFFFTKIIFLLPLFLSKNYINTKKFVYFCFIKHNKIYSHNKLC